MSRHSGAGRRHVSLRRLSLFFKKCRSLRASTPTHVLVYMVFRPYHRRLAEEFEPPLCRSGHGARPDCFRRVRNAAISSVIGMGVSAWMGPAAGRIHGSRPHCGIAISQPDAPASAGPVRCRDRCRGLLLRQSRAPHFLASSGSSHDEYRPAGSGKAAARQAFNDGLTIRGCGFLLPKHQCLPLPRLPSLCWRYEVRATAQKSLRVYGSVRPRAVSGFKRFRRAPPA